MAGINSLIDAEGSHFIRRCIAFAIDIIFAAGVAMLIPSTVAEVSGGRYRLTAGPGFHFTYCYPSSEHSKSTAAIIDQVVRSAPSHVGQPKIENCVTVLNLLARNTFVQIGFARTDQHLGWRLVRVATAVSPSGSIRLIITCLCSWPYSCRSSLQAPGWAARECA